MVVRYNQSHFARPAVLALCIPPMLTHFPALRRWLWLALWLPLVVQASSLALTQAGGPFKASAHAEHFTGSTAQTALADVAAAGAVFQPYADRKIDLGAGGHWIRLMVRNADAVPAPWLLDLGVPDLERLEVYQQDAAGMRTLIRLDAASRFADRPVPARLLAVPVALPANEQVQLYIHYRVHGDTPLRLQFMTRAQFADRLADSNLVNGLIIGALLLLLAFAVAQFFALRRQAYGYYSLMLTAVVLFLLQIEGYLYQWLWHDAGRWNQVAPVVLVGLIHLGHAAFAATLFRLRRTLPWLFRLYLVYGFLMTAATALFVLTGNLTALVALSLVFSPVNPVVGLLALRRRLPAAGYFLAGAVSIGLCMNVLFSLSVAGVAGLADIDIFLYPKIGYLLEALLFAAALGRLVQLLHQRNEAALQHRLAEAEQLAQAELARGRALQAVHQQQLQLAAAGHDLSQPLSSIRFALAALRARTDQEAAARHIDKTLDYCESLLRELITEARSQVRQNAQWLALGDVLRDAQARHRAAAEQKGLQLRVCPSSAEVLASGLIVARILDNLIGNAIRYTSRGQVLLGVRRRSAGLEIQVIDTGPGMDLAQRERLLAPFTQSGGLDNEHLGYGLGLH
ncbi:sensor histidine kinase, partial [Chitinimonas sp.]|uniref:sensor histidine kinase n=1 Tax=Chitinimonas sp. TaxID=1934313 RepID=UPI0035ADB119